MSKTLAKQTEVRESPISGLGVFAVTGFRKGETVIEWKPKARIQAEQIEDYPPEEQEHIAPMPDGSYLVMGEPERYVNHSCDPNTIVQGEADVALRDIPPGEEITSSFSDDSVGEAFQCRCGAECCKGWIGRSKT